MTLGDLTSKHVAIALHHAENRGLIVVTAILTSDECFVDFHYWGF